MFDANLTIGSASCAAPGNSLLRTARRLHQSERSELPSIAIGALAGSQTVKRTVTNVGSQTETYTASTSLPGISVSVMPSTFTIAPGASKTYTVRFAQDYG